MDSFDRHGNVVQIIGAVYLALMLSIRTADYGYFGLVVLVVLVVLVEVMLAPLGIVAVVLIAVPYFRRRRL